MKDLKAQVFVDPPADFANHIEVATCYIRSGNEFLFVKRCMDSTQGGLWGIPGGKIKKGLPVEAELLRELVEETSLDFSSKTVEALGTVYIRYPEVDFSYHMYGINLEWERPEVIINPEEHTDYAWWSLKEALAHPLILLEDACTFLVWNGPFFEGCEKPLLRVPANNID